MKIKLLALAAVATFMFACGGGDTPEKVAEDFHKSLGEKDFAKAKGLATKKGEKDIQTLEEMSKSMGAMGGEEKAEKVEIEKVTCAEVKDDKTTCTCKEKNGKETKYNMVKEDGKWKVDYSKMGDMGGGETPIEPEPIMEEEVEVEEEATDEATTVE